MKRNAIVVNKTMDPSSDIKNNFNVSEKVFPYTQYNCSVTAKTSLGFGLSATVTANTLQAGWCFFFLKNLQDRYFRFQYPI